MAKKTNITGFIRKNLLSGVAMLFPLFVTVYLLAIIFQFFDGLVGDYVNSYLNTHYGFSVPGLGLVVLLLATLGAGFLYNYFFGNKLWPLVEKLFYRIPFVANIYPSAKELSQFLFTSKSKEKFEKVVSIEFPMKGTYSIGFITNDNVKKLKSIAEKTLISVFVPLAPTPVSGHILLVPEDKVQEIDITIDEAIKFVVSGGVVLSKANK